MKPGYKTLDCVGSFKERVSVLECGSPVPPWDNAWPRLLPFRTTIAAMDRSAKAFCSGPINPVFGGSLGLRGRHRTAALQGAVATAKLPPASKPLPIRTVLGGPPWSRSAALTLLTLLMLLATCLCASAVTLHNYKIQSSPSGIFRPILGTIADGSTLSSPTPPGNQRYARFLCILLLGYQRHPSGCFGRPRPDRCPCSRQPGRFYDDRALSAHEQ